jgi:hypothetical protein
METKKDVRNKFKDYIFEEPYPDMNVFCQITGTSSNDLNGPDYSLLREAALAKMVEYLRQRLGCITLKDGKLLEGIKYFESTASFVVDALKNASPGDPQDPAVYQCEKDHPGLPCLFIKTKMSMQRYRQFLFWTKALVSFLAWCMIALIAGFYLGKLLAGV